METISLMLSIIIGMLAAIVYNLRMTVQMNEKLDKLLKHQGISLK